MSTLGVRWHLEQRAVTGICEVLSELLSLELLESLLLVQRTFCCMGTGRGRAGDCACAAVVWTDIKLEAMMGESSGGWVGGLKASRGCPAEGVVRPSCTAKGEQSGVSFANRFGRMVK